MPDFIKVSQLVQKLQCGSTELHAHTARRIQKNTYFPYRNEIKLVTDEENKEF
jgi:hypothetical protein